MIATESVSKHTKDYLARYSRTYDNAPRSRFHTFVAIASAGGDFSDGYVLGTIGIALTLARGPLRLDAIWMGLLGAASLAGLFFGSLFLAPFADRIGRRPFLASTMAVFSAISIVQFFVTTSWQLLWLRFALGLVLGIDYVVCCTIVAEFSPLSSRGRLLSLLTVMWTVGYCTAFLVGTFLTEINSHAWRWLLLSSAIPSAAIFFVRLAIPESPPWLVQRGRAEEARAIIDRHIGSDVALPVITPTKPQSTMSQWTELLGPRYRRRTAIGVIFFTALVIPYFALGTFVPVVFGALGISNALISGAIFNVFMVLGSVFGFWFVDRIPRRTFLVVSFYVSAATLALLAMRLTLLPSVTVAVASAFAFVLAAATVLCFVYPPELFPTRLRASGVGISVSSSRVGSAGSTFLLPILVESIGIRSSLGICVGVLLLGGIACQIYAPETRGMAMESLN